MSLQKSRDVKSENKVGRKKSKKEKRKDAPLSKVQKFEIVRIHRRDIKNAPYNPRQIDDHARKKLEANLKKNGLLSPLVWNKRSGNLVSGHQRLACMDILQGSDNYQMDIAAVDLDDKTEKEQNIFFNNASAMGTWDVDALGAMFAGDSEVDYKAAGFDDMDLQMIFDDTEYATTMFDMSAAPQAVKDNVTSLEEIQKMKRARKDFKEEDIAANDTEFFAVVVFPNRQTQGRFMERIGMTKDDRYVDGVRLYSSLEAIKPPTKGEFLEEKFWIAKDQKKVVDDEITRISSTLQGKNIRGRALEYMAVNSSHSSLDNLMGKGEADVRSEEAPSDIERARRKKEKKKRKKEKMKRMREKLKDAAT